MQKILLTKKELLKPYIMDVRIMRLFQTFGLAGMIVFTVMFLRVAETRGRHDWFLLVIGAVLFAGLFLIPLASFRHSLSIIKKIKSNQFRIAADTIVKKSSYTVRNAGDDRSRWIYRIESASVGELPELSKTEWDHCSEGEQIYIVYVDRKMTNAYPESVYQLSDEIEALR